MGIMESVIGGLELTALEPLITLAILSLPFRGSGERKFIFTMRVKISLGFELYSKLRKIAVLTLLHY